MWMWALLSFTLSVIEEIGMPAAAISAVQALTDFVQTSYGVPPIETRILISCLLPTRHPPVWMLIQSERNRFLNDLAYVFIRLNSFDLTDTVHFRGERPRFHNRFIMVALADRDQETHLFVDRYWQQPGPRLWRTSRYPLLAQECVRMRLTFDPGRFPDDMVRDQLYEHVRQALGAALGDRGGILPARPDEDLERRINLLPLFDPLLANRTALFRNLCFIPANHAALCGRKEITEADRRAQAHVLRSCVPIWVEKVLREYLRLGENRVKVDTVVKAAGLDDGAKGRTCGHQIIQDLSARGVLEGRRIAYRPTYRIRPGLVSDIEHILAG